MSQQLHGRVESASPAGLRSFTTAFLVSLCMHGALVGAVWRFAATQRAQPAPRELRVELTSSPRPEAAAESTPVDSEPGPDSPERKFKDRKDRSDRRARTHATAAQPRAQTDGAADGGSIPPSRPADAGVPLAVERRETRESKRPIDLRVMDWLARYRTYPLEARRARLEGVVQLRVTLLSDGRLVDARVEQSSGHLVLDRAALDLLARASPLPDEFASERSEQVELRLPIVYRMRAPSS